MISVCRGWALIAPFSASDLAEQQRDGGGPKFITMLPGSNVPHLPLNVESARNHGDDE